MDFDFAFRPAMVAADHDQAFQARPSAADVGVHPVEVVAGDGLAALVAAMGFRERFGLAPVGGMTIVSDPAASGGAYVWLAEGGFPGNEQSFNSARSAAYPFNLPRPGNWILEGLTRSASSTSDSFWVSVDGGAPTR